MASLFGLNPSLIHFTDTIITEDTENSVSELHHDEDETEIGLDFLFDEDVCF
jgi:hypothetical protein